jgi:hypothetical protein
MHFQMQHREVAIEQKRPGEAQAAVDQTRQGTAQAAAGKIRPADVGRAVPGIVKRCRKVNSKP